jgi:hypothetical protein
LKAEESLASSATVFIAGAGQLGSRYLQGLHDAKTPLRIYVYDIDARSLERARLLWTEVAAAETLHKVTFNSSLESLPKELDIVIVTTTASVRPQVVSEISAQSRVRYWILEKVLAQSIEGLDILLEQIGTDSKAWVNKPRRMLPWHHQIDSYLDKSSPMTMVVNGGLWGLACNSIHFLDIFSMWTGEVLVSINTEGLESTWFEGKRAGNWEVLGSMSAQFSGGSAMTLSAQHGEVFYSFEFKDASYAWNMTEQLGVAIRSDGLEVKGRIPFQSELSGPLVDSILKNGECQLPYLEESVEMHLSLIHI